MKEVLQQALAVDNRVNRLSTLILAEDACKKGYKL